MYGPLQSFERLALLEGSRLEELGDMAGAWGRHRAIPARRHHVGMMYGFSVNRRPTVA